MNLHYYITVCRDAAGVPYSPPKRIAEDAQRRIAALLNVCEESVLIMLQAFKNSFEQNEILPGWGRGAEFW